MNPTYDSDVFEWDGHNVNKIWNKHRVKFSEAEEIFFDERLKITPDIPHSEKEQRHLALGKTREGRYLFVVFTERKGKLRVISARDMSRKERRGYREEIEEDPAF